MLREDTEREARATSVLAVGPFRDDEKSLLMGGQKYRLEILKAKHSGFGTLNNQRFGSKFVEEVANPSDSDFRWLT